MQSREPQPRAQMSPYIPGRACIIPVDRVMCEQGVLIHASQVFDILLRAGEILAEPGALPDRMDLMS